jgi:hypothetical protein
MLTVSFHSRTSPALRRNEKVWIEFVHAKSKEERGKRKEFAPKEDETHRIQQASPPAPSMSDILMLTNYNFLQCGS